MGSESLRSRTEWERAAMKPRKWRPAAETWKRRMSSGEEMRLDGISKWKGGSAGGTRRGWGTGERTMEAVAEGVSIVGDEMKVEEGGALDKEKLLQEATLVACTRHTANPS
ncbi:hypothetical protein MUK42_04652 [Musa troglodytarum]|uniref:Uncharacterized protein n=1 Tax=Musa troglodytarum TaxID=320322 RepID=A0A9E7GFP0_9LILI|nr:hypothetical protein MUK42_04652 [Musa troglodytarum]